MTQLIVKRGPATEKKKMVFGSIENQSSISRGAIIIVRTEIGGGIVTMSQGFESSTLTY